MLKYGIGCLILLAVTIGVIALTALWAMGIYNNIVTKSQAVESQWAQVENVYQRRADLIPNLVRTVQGAANFEKSTLTEIVAARASVGQVKLTAQDAADPQKFQQFERAQNNLSSALSRLLVVVERYPELKATQNFTGLQVQLEGTENRISVERGRFNEVVQAYNTYILQLPNSLVANFAGFHQRPYFSSKPGSDVPPEVNFDTPKTSSAAPTPAPAR